MANTRETAQAELNYFKQELKTLRGGIKCCKYEIHAYKQCKDDEYKIDNKQYLKTYKHLLKDGRKMILKGHIHMAVLIFVIIIAKFMEWLEGKK